MPFKDSTNKTPRRYQNDNSQIAGTKTPKSAKKENRSISQKTPSHNLSMSFNKSKGGLKRRELTPSRNPNYSGVGGGDRFIPNRSETQFEYANHCLINHNSEDDSLLNMSTSAPTSPSKAEKAYMMKMMRAKSVNDLDTDIEDRILCYKKGKAPQPPLGYLTQPKVLYTSSAMKPSGSVSKGLRYIPNSPERILDAPNFMDDYYMNVIHWSYDNVIAVALTYALYLWNASTGEIITLFELPEESGNYITSVQWAEESSILAVGLSNGFVKLFDPARENSLLRTMQCQISRVGCLAWRQHVLSATNIPSRCPCPEFPDRLLPEIWKNNFYELKLPLRSNDDRVKGLTTLRIAAISHTNTFPGHGQEVCGLVWSSDGHYLASGGGDNLVKIWEPSMLTADDPDPLYNFSDHLASVKAIAFNPHQAHSLATGGGTVDRTIKFWNLASGTLCHSQDTDSQVNALAFTPNYKELISGHGYPGNDLKIWKYPSMTCLKVLTGHTERILGLTISPCGQYVMSASSDESLRLWWCFKVDKSIKQRWATKNSRLVPSVR
uniref:Anaphase-promoting complex subunit 4-like WD40 domain-containing protein n=1 Tax=Setaria digitata TaxID=48799 RepID=A0A915PML6_9BILA